MQEAIAKTIGSSDGGSDAAKPTCRIIQWFIAIVALQTYANAFGDTLPCREYSSPVPAEVAPMFANLIRAALDQPTVRAIDAYATKARSQKAGKGWITSYANCGPGFTPGFETIGGDDGNDMIFVMITLDFDPVSIVEALGKTFGLREETGEKDTKSQTNKYELSYQGRVVGQVWLERSIDVEHYNGGTAVFYSSKKVQELMNKARVAEP
jgi:hypothetical protein